MNAGTGAAISILLLSMLLLLASVISLYVKIKVQEIKMSNIESKLNDFILENTINAEKMSQNYTKTDILCPEYIEALGKQALKRDKTVISDKNIKENKKKDTK